MYNICIFIKLFIIQIHIENIDWCPTLIFSSQPFLISLLNVLFVSCPTVIYGLFSWYKIFITVWKSWNYKFKWNCLKNISPKILIFLYRLSFLLGFFYSSFIFITIVIYMYLLSNNKFIQKYKYLDRLSQMYNIPTFDKNIPIFKQFKTQTLFYALCIHILTHILL